MVPERQAGATNPASRWLPGPQISGTAAPSEARSEDDDDLLAAIEPLSEPRTVPPMTPHGLELKARSDLLVAGVRGTHSRIRETRQDLAQGTRAPVIPLITRVPDLEHPPTTRTVVEKGIVSVQLKGQTILELLGWSPGALRGSLDGAWVVLTRDLDGPPPRRNDGRSTVSPIGKLRLSGAVLHQAGVGIGDEIALLVLPNHGALALCHPARLLTGAPLSILDAELVAHRATTTTSTIPRQGERS